jgi:2-polyprenyl-3-methyl-5-hydroxy-6-metoxy-1,4-benzoquinol methylase
MEWRLVITVKNATQMLKVIEIVESITDLRAIKQVAKLRSDIEFSCPQYNDVKTALPDVESFLKYGTINVDGLFYGKSQTIQFSKGVTLVIYNESRHWLDALEKVQGNTLLNMDVDDLLAIKLNETRELVRTLPLAPTADLQETLGRFCSAIIIKLFLRTRLSDYLVNGNKISFQNAFSLCEMISKYKKFFFVMVRELWLNGLLEATGTDNTIHCLDEFVFKCKHHLDVDLNVIADNAIKTYPSWADCFRFPLYCSQHLEKVVRGNMSPLSVIYPHGDLNFMFQFDKLGDLCGDVYYNMYMQLIASYAKQLSGQGRHVRMIEVGAGVGHVTRQLLPKLKNMPNVEYWFTDLGKAFVDHAKTTFSDYLHMMKFATFDITKSAPKQGVFGSFDIIVSYNVIHTTQSITKSVLNLKSCLAGDGKLFIIESAKNETWATLAWGIWDGWWFFEDYDLRPAEPMMEPEKWEQVLESVGFQSVLTCPSQREERKHVEKFLFLCSSDSRKGAENVSSIGWWETDDGK